MVSTSGSAPISDDAKVVDWEFNLIREGSSGWTCLPDRPDTAGNDPWCVAEAWLNSPDAYVSKADPSQAS